MSIGLIGEAELDHQGPRHVLYTRRRLRTDEPRGGSRSFCDCDSY